MAKHKKKKPNRQLSDKIIKAQARNEFYRRLKKMLKAIDCEGVFDLISPKLLDLLFNARGFPINVLGSEENTFDTDDLKWFKKGVNYHFKTKMIDLELGGSKIDLYTISSIGIPLVIYAIPIIEQSLVKHPHFQEKLKRFKDSPKPLDYIIDYLWEITEYMCFLMSDLRTRIYWTNNASQSDDEKLQLGFNLTIHGEIPEKTYVTINHDKHIASRVGWTLDLKPVWQSIKPEKLGLRSVGKDNTIDVYIQDHALNRITERNDCVYIQYLWIWLNISVADTKYHINEVTGKYMIDFRVYDVKTGYLVAQIIDAKLIIQTFLLLTNDGTPEGKKLHANTGLSKADKEYLRLDRLSTFASPEVQCNQKIRGIFKEAGCDSLFHLKAELDKHHIMLKNPASASLIEDYLMMNEEKDKEMEWDDACEENYSNA